MNYSEYRERVALLTDEQKDRIRAKCQWEGRPWLGIAADWPSLFDVSGMPAATPYRDREEKQEGPNA